MLVLLLLTLFAPSAAPAPPDAAALLALKSSTDPQDSLHFNRSTSPCFWTGIRCSEPGRVIRLVAESSNLTGTLPSSSSFHHLDQLRVLSLSFNSLSGPIPDLSPLLNLKSLFLSHNRLSGPFPPSLLSLRRLRTLDLAHNLLSGPIPPSLAVAPARIYALRLESNRFVGAIPPLNQSSLRFFNVCNNNLSGPVPVTAALSGFGDSAFGGNPGLCGEAVRRECRAHLVFFHGPDRIAPSPAGEAQLRGLISSASSPPPTRKIRRRGVVVVLSLAAAFLVIGIVGILLALKQRRMRNGKRLNPESDAAATGAVESMDVVYGGRNGCEIEDGNDELAAAVTMSEDKVKKLGKSGSLMFCAGEAPVYALEQLMRASAEMLGRGSIGSTYKAVLDNRLIVCVKRLDASKLAATGKETFERHMDVVGRLRHPNLVPLRAYFQAKEERLLVYDYQPNGSLYSLIHGSRSTRAKPLHWTSCLKIAEDVAQGLAYIHQASRLVHGNVKSSNVLLGSEFEACLTDNCLSFLVEPSDGEDDSGYRAPETRKSNRRLTPRSDIYAFGILLLELLTGKPPLQHQILIATDLPVWVRSVREDEAGTEDERLGLIIDIATACVRSSPESRPTTWQVLKMIQEVKEEDTGDNDNDSASIS